MLAVKSIEKTKACFKKEGNREGLRALAKFSAVWVDAVDAMGESRATSDGIDRDMKETQVKFRIVEALL